MMLEEGLCCDGVLVEGPSCTILLKVWVSASSDVVGIYERMIDRQAV